MYLDQSLPSGGGWHGPFCLSCKGLILDERNAVRIRFDSDPDGEQGLSGSYHRACSKPFASIAQAIAMLSRYGR